MTGFFDLPPEMRNSIYELLLTGSLPSLNMLTASRLLQEEAASYYYQNNAFTVDLTKDVSSGAVIVPPISDKYLKYSKVLTVNIKLGYVSSAKVIQQTQRLAALANHSKFATLTLNFTSTASRVVSSTVDDCVLHASHPLTLALQHLLSHGVAGSMCVNLDGVWFAPGVGKKLLSEFEGGLEVVTSGSSIERRGHEARDHMRELGLDMKDLEDAEDLQPLDYDGELPSLPSSLKSALSELDVFSPTGYRDEGAEDSSDPAKEDQLDSLFDELMFDMDDLEGEREDELTEDDDVDGAAMEDIDEIEAILGNLVEVHYQRVTEKDICYMANFAPNMLRRVSESSA